MRPEEPRIVSRSHQFGGAALNEPSASGRGTGRVTLGSILHGLRVELRALLEAYQLTPTWLWLAIGGASLGLACLGLLPIGAWSFVLQLVGFALLSWLVVWPELAARLLRSSDSFGILKRDSPAVVTYLPVAISAFSLPFHLCAQAVLFRKVMQFYPGLLSGSSWSEAWRYAIDSLLFTELFLDLFDVLDLGLAGDAPSLAGRSLVFFTRLILSIGFVRIVLTLMRAAFYRAHGLGRGDDSITRLERAAASGDAVLAGHLGRELTADVNATVEVLLRRRSAGDDSVGTTRSLLALRDWAIPYLRMRITHGDPRGDSLEETLEELSNGAEQQSESKARLRPVVIAALSVSGVAVAVVIALGPPIIAFAAGLACMLLLTWLLISPRASFELMIERGVLPFVSLERLRSGVLGWAALLATGFLLASWGTLLAAGSAWPSTFAPDDAQVNARSVLGFVGSSLLRVQLFFSVPDVFQIGSAGLEAKPVLGSFLTFLLRTGLNLGAAAVVMTGLSIRRDREGLSGLLGVPDTLGMRMEALRGGRYAHLLVAYYDLTICSRLWNALDAARNADTQEAMAGSGAFDWCVLHPSLGDPGTAERLKAQSFVVEALHDRGWFEPAEAWSSELIGELSTGAWPSSARALVLAKLARMAAHDGSEDAATALYASAYEALLEDQENPESDPAASLEAQAVWVRSVSRGLGVLSPDALEKETTSELAERAAEVAESLVDRLPARFATDVLRLGALRAAIVGRMAGPAAGFAELSAVAAATLAMPPQHPWREVLLLNLVGSASALEALAIAGGDDRTTASAAKLQADLLGELGRRDDAWYAKQLAVRAYDERLGEELAQSVGVLAGLTPSNAAFTTAMRAADIFEARFEAGVFEARGYAVGMRMFAAVTAFHVEDWTRAVEAAERVFALAEGMRPSPSDDQLLANTHAFYAQASKRLGREEIAQAHAGAARSLYERIAASGWEDAESAVAEGLTYLQGL